MPDVQILAPGTHASPLDYVVPGAQEILIKAMAASYDGSGAGGSYVPCLQLIAPGGVVAATCPYGLTLAAGVSADVSWFPRVAGSGGTISLVESTDNTVLVTGGSGPTVDLSVRAIQPIDDYVFANSNTVVTGLGFTSQTNLIIQGNPVTLDGLTRIKVEFFAPLAQITGNPPSSQAIGFELWDGVTNKGTMGYVVGNTKAAATALEVGGPVKLETILTPSAGTHTYAVYAWRNVIGGTCTVFASTFVDGSGNLAPTWYRVTRT